MTMTSRSADADCPPGGQDPAVAAPPAPSERGAFTIGSTMRHVLVMTAAGSVGLISVFFVDFLSLLYISRLGDPSLTAAVGYASQISFLLISVSIGLSIAIGALVSRALGAGDRARARRLSASGLTHVGVVMAVLSVAAMPFTHAILAALGARGDALAVGATYLRMILPASLFLSLGMAFSSVMRAVGDAKRAMYVTLGGAIVTACLDPIFIFGFHLGIYGAAMVLVISRLCLVGVGWHGAVRVHDLVARPVPAHVLADLAPMLTIAGPAILTNLATPVSSIYTMRIFSSFGQETVAAFAIIDRVTPVAFGALFALSGSVGPIMGQNFGARLMGRVRRVLTDCLTVSVVFVALVSGLLHVSAPGIVHLFGATGETARLLRFFCSYGGLLWFFLGGIFVANAAYNNLGAPYMSAIVNWGRATLGTIPFVTYGAAHYGAQGGFIGMIAGAMIFGVLAVGGAYRVVARLARTRSDPMRGIGAESEGRPGDATDG